MITGGAAGTLLGATAGLGDSWILTVEEPLEELPMLVCSPGVQCSATLTDSPAKCPPCIPAHTSRALLLGKPTFFHTAP